MSPHDPDKRLKQLGMAMHGIGLSTLLALGGVAYALVGRPLWEDIRQQRGLGRCPYAP